MSTAKPPLNTYVPRKQLFMKRMIAVQVLLWFADPESCRVMQQMTGAS